MFDKLKKGLSLISICIPIIYVIGFIIVNSYLSRYSLSDIEVLSLNYLKAGIFFMGMLIIVIAGIFASFGKFTDVKYDMYFVLLHNCLFVSVFLGFILFKPTLAINPEQNSFILFAAGQVCLCIYVLIRLLTRNKIDTNKRIFIFRMVCLSILLLPVLIWMGQMVPVIKWFLIFYIGLSILFTLELGDYYVGNFKLLNLSFKIVGLSGLVILFGYSIYGHLPGYASGPTVFCKSIHFKDYVKINNENVIHLENKEIIYYTPRTYFISVDDTTLLQVNSETILNITYNRKK